MNKFSLIMGFTIINLIGTSLYGEAGKSEESKCQRDCYKKTFKSCMKQAEKSAKKQFGENAEPTPEAVNSCRTEYQQCWRTCD